MTTKELKFLEMFEEFSKINITADKLGTAKQLKTIMDFDYQMAVNVWEYYSSVKEEKLSKDENFSLAIGFEFLNLFYVKANTKCIKAIADVPAIRRSVFQYSRYAGDENALQIIVDFIVANKLPIAEEILKCLTKNTRIHYGQILKRILEKVFIELLKKNPNKVEFSKKTADLYLTYVNKIKTEEKALIIQRIKETR